MNNEEIRIAAERSVEAIIQDRFESFPLAFKRRIRHILLKRFEVVHDVSLTQAILQMQTEEENTGREHPLTALGRVFILFELDYDADKVYLAPIPNGVFCCCQRYDGVRDSQIVVENSAKMNEEANAIISSVSDYLNS